MTWKLFVLRILQALLYYLPASLIVKKSAAVLITTIICDLLFPLHLFLCVPRAWTATMMRLRGVCGLFNVEIHRKTLWIRSWMISLSLFSLFFLELLLFRY